MFDDGIELEGTVQKIGNKYVAHINTRMAFEVELTATAYDTPRFAAATLARGMQAMGYRGRVTLRVPNTNDEWDWYLGQPNGPLSGYLYMELMSEADKNY